MKKIGVIIAIIAVIAVVALAGCVSGPKGEQLDQLTLDLSLLPATRNAAPLTRQWADFIIDLTPILPENVDWGFFTRMIVKVNYYDVNGRMIEHDNDLAMLTLVYDLSKLEVPDFGRGADPGVNIGNAAQKQFNLMGQWSNVHTRGCMVMLTKAPGALVLQNSNPRVAFLEIVEITFYNEDLVSFEDDI